MPRHIQYTHGRLYRMAFLSLSLSLFLVAVKDFALTLRCIFLLWASFSCLRVLAPYLFSTSSFAIVLLNDLYAIVWYIAPSKPFSSVYLVSTTVWRSVGFVASRARTLIHAAHSISTESIPASLPDIFIWIIWTVLLYLFAVSSISGIWYENSEKLALTREPLP